MSRNATEHQASLMTTQKVMFHKYFYALACVASLLAAVVDYQSQHLLVAGVELGTSLLALGFLLYLYHNHFPPWAIPVSALVSFLVFTAAAFTQMNLVTSLIWLPVFPVIYFFLTDFRQGIWWTALSTMVFIAGFLIHPLIYDTIRVPATGFVQSLSAFLFAAALAFFYERIRAKNEQLLQKNADYDFLTGINNRRSLTSLLEFQINQAARYEKNPSFLLFDVDNFKQVNDRYGHKTGDVLLKSLSKLTRATIRKSDVLARWGGEEFAILMPETEHKNAAILAEKLRQKIEAYQFLTVGHITVSIGVAELRHGEGMDELIMRADQALYCAKRDNKNCVKVSE